ncbi:Pkinase-domain-containing protein [Neolentinus lepideus HHB14362 ss-1]|uniref:non-specific serine/threonine protein kinase n=1 Tax=Neolentinus lepideus HHB14362 ss-1 TaxID=1314782 RepID=A0A165QAX0_9AGAM|nr:Pkinase-domain-containing protein [Neolentinus lepideus HHB14362 ss-1]
MALHLDHYESLDIIGNGSFGIIRKVKRKSDGMIFARKELRFEKMTERDRKQIVSEVNILKDLHHEHIVRYHDRHIDRDHGTLYILMEYCGGGDLSTVIKQAVKQNRTIPEDTIWNYFMQILLALHHCHHPNGHGRASSGGPGESDGRERRPQILHRDLKPDNVFLSESNTVKLGDFGLSKALPQASFANTYVGTPYYMSPELMQEKAYDSKSDIWSLGCLIYELCALKPPFHDAKTHAELSVFIRNGRIPPLPRGYSTALGNVIKSMLTLNPAMRPSAAQLLQHERIDLAYKVSETEKMIAQVKHHKAAAAARERDLLAREAALKERESHLATLLQKKQSELDITVRTAVARREEELRAAVLKREVEVAASMQKREEEILEAVQRQQDMINERVRVREETMREAIEERMRWVERREAEMREERERIEEIRKELERKMRTLEEAGSKSQRKERKGKNPFEEVKNILAPLSRLGIHDSREPFPVFETPISQSVRTFSSLLSNAEPPASAMKGVILTSTGEPLATPTPSELAKLFVQSPKVGLNFSQIFDADSDDGDETVTIHIGEEGEGASDTETEGGMDKEEPPSPIERRESMRRASRGSGNGLDQTVTAPPTRLRRPSIRNSMLSRPSLPGSSSAPAVNARLSSTAAPTASTSSASAVVASTSEPTVSSKTTVSTRARTISRTSSSPPQYDFSDEENLPSPFLKRTEKERGTLARAQSSSAALAVPKRLSGGSNLLRVAAANSSAKATTLKKQPSTSAIGTYVASARRAGEEARRALHRS